MTLTLNGRPQTFDLVSPLTLSTLLDSLGMKPDRIAVELNNQIVPRDRWAVTQVIDGAKIEVVHFVGGGVGTSCQTCE
jgi:thiamine biosynthesis protein ThiS